MGVPFASGSRNVATDWVRQSYLTRVTRGNLAKVKGVKDSVVPGPRDGRKPEAGESGNQIRRNESSLAKLSAVSSTPHLSAQGPTESVV